jgi:hypothetical protein
MLSVEHIIGGERVLFPPCTPLFLFHKSYKIILIKLLLFMLIQLSNAPEYLIKVHVAHAYASER